jgi:hypothetical protein
LPSAMSIVMGWTPLNCLCKGPMRMEPTASQSDPGCSPFWPSPPAHRCQPPSPPLISPPRWRWMKRLLPLRLPSPRFPPLLVIPIRTTCHPKPFPIPPLSLGQVSTSHFPWRSWRTEQPLPCPPLRWRLNPAGLSPPPSFQEGRQTRPPLSRPDLSCPGTLAGLVARRFRVQA